MMLTSTLAAAEPLYVKCKKMSLKKPSYQQYELGSTQAFIPLLSLLFCTQTDKYRAFIQIYSWLLVLLFAAFLIFTLTISYQSVVDT